MKVNVPPIKSQGIKTKLVPWINSLVPADFDGVWIEPFMGTGVVGFNIAPQQALFGDCNPHLINFYTAVSTQSITPAIVRHYLTEEGEKLQERGESHYYAIRERFNQKHNPLDFLFLSRAGFNGMIRFNQKGGFNVPFCRKPERFAPAYITKIVNQVNFVSKLLKMKDFSFACQDFSETIEQATADDIIYCDPPYIGRHVDYFSGWDESQELKLFEMLSQSPAKFILSTWHHNDYRENEFIATLWHQFNILTREHFYHVGASEKNRSPMIEAIVTNFDLPSMPYQTPRKAVQLALLEKQANYTIE
ncbi:MAG: Dam family site-specific DNA-(adenine-N6)-methyltransferase [Chloroflexi bacterium]|nr:Dam family site-specific DNA-(adenine-N6)-methyltransferase [Chloroflexota bacterium]